MQEIKRYVDGRQYICRPYNPKRPKRSRDGDTFYVFWSRNGRSERKSTGAKSVGEAQAFLDEWLRPGAAQPADWTCEDLFRLKYPELENGRADAAWKHLGPVYGALEPSAVTRDTETGYVAARCRAGAARATVRAEIAMLRASWNAAVRERRLPSDALPVLGPLPPNSPPRDRWLREDEIERVLTAAKADSRRAYLFCAIALDACARRTAIQDLRWDQVDWGVGVIHFLPDGAAQTRKRRPSVAMSKRLRSILEDAYATRGSDPYVIGAGGRVNPALARVGAAAGVEGLTPHVFRHTAATWMARRGVDLWVVAKVLGNTMEQVEKVYAKWQPGAGRAAVDSIAGE